MQNVLPLLRLVRFPNVFTAIADIAMGFLFVRGTLTPWLLFAMVALASSCLYMAGMVLNDVFDIEQDRHQRPARPLPAGAISITQATWLGFGLLVAGVAWALLSSLWSLDLEGVQFRTPWIAVTLAVAIIAYDSILKRTPWGPVNMGLCRALNILLGMSVPSAFVGPYFGFDASQLVVALGLGTYVAGITWFARDEAQAEKRINLYGGMVVMLVGLSLLAAFPRFAPFVDGGRTLTFAWSGAWPLAIVMLTLSTIRRCSLAVAHVTPQSVQTAVKQCILSLIVFDAAVSMAVCSHVGWSVGVLSLLVPFLWFGRYVYST